MASVIPTFNESIGKINTILEAIDLLQSKLEEIFPNKKMITTICDGIYTHEGYEVNHVIFAIYIISSMYEKNTILFKNDINEFEVKLLVITSILLGIKICEDAPWTNKYWARKFGYELKILNNAEFIILKEYEIDFSPSIERIWEVVNRKIEN